MLLMEGPIKGKKYFIEIYFLQLLSNRSQTFQSDFNFVINNRISEKLFIYRIKVSFS